MNNFGLKYFFVAFLCVFGWLSISAQPSEHDTGATAIDPNSRWRPEAYEDHCDTVSDRAESSSKRSREGRDRNAHRTVSRSKRVKAVYDCSKTSCSRRNRDRDRVELISQEEDAVILKCTYVTRDVREKTEFVVLTRLADTTESVDFQGYRKTRRIDRFDKINADWTHKLPFLVEKHAIDYMTKHEHGDSVRDDCGWNRQFKNDTRDKHILAVEMMILPDGHTWTLAQVQKKKSELVTYYKQLGFGHRCSSRPHVKLGVVIWAVGSQGDDAIMHRQFHAYDSEFYTRQS